MFCSNCGEKTSEKKICEKCNVKIDSVHNFCKWCGTKLEENAKTCPNCKEKTKSESTIVKILFYILGVLCIVVGLVSLAGGDYLPGIFFGLFGVLLLPAIKNLIKKSTCKTAKLHSTVMIIRIVVMVALLVGFVATLPPSDPAAKDNSNNTVDVSKEAVIHNNQQALNAAKAYIQSNSNKVEQEIADECGFTKFFTPTFASYQTHSESDSWTITVKGNIAGYVDEHATEFRKYKFDLKLYVSADGSVRIGYVNKS